MLSNWPKKGREVAVSMPFDQSSSQTCSQGPSILGIIPARGGSKGLPKKNILPLAGIPLIVYTVRAAQRCKLLTDCLVSTDDPAVVAISRKAGAKTPFLRPAELAKDDVSIWPVVRHAVHYWETNEHRTTDIVVLLQPTSPLRTEKDIASCIVRFQELNADICCTAVVPHDNPYFNMVEITSESAPFAVPCTPFMKKNQRRQTAPPVFSLNGAVYVVRRSVLESLENQFALERFAVSEMATCRSVDIDTAEDLELAKFWLSRQKKRHA